MRKTRAPRRQNRTDARLRRALAAPPALFALVCESDPERSDALKRALAPLGAVASVWSRSDVLEAAARARPRVVVFGDHTAKLGDFGAPRRLRELAPHIPIVLVTARVAWASSAPSSASSAAWSLFDAIVVSARDAAEACERLVRGEDAKRDEPRR